MNVGRYIPEILRIIEALQVAEKSMASMPANWMPCEPVINKSPQTFDGVLEKIEQIHKDNNGMSWYLSFKEPNGCK